MIITPSIEQIDVFHHINYSDKNLIVSAVAGSGKTTTLLEALNRISEKKTVLFMAFNRAINDELIKRAPKRANIMIKTVHGFGFNMLLEYDKDIKTNFYKYNNIFRNVLDFIKDGNIEIIRKYDFKTPELKLIEKLKTIINDNFEVDPEFNVDEYGSRVIDLCDIARLYNIGSREKKKLNELAEHHSILNTCKEAESTIILMRLGTYYTKEIDFTDMIYLPNVLGLSCTTFDYVFIDECQDLNVCQKLIMLKAINKGGKFVAVGDPGQCQPDGTKILKSSGELVNIEDIKIGDHLVSYDRRTGYYVGFGRNNWSNKNIERYGVKVNNLKRREFNGLLYKITSSTGKVSKYTENHKTLVKFNNYSLTGYFLYLMEKNGIFRIGITSVWDKSGENFGTFRAKQEKADKFWVLNYYENQNLAYIDEQYYSVAYSIPQMRFNHRGQSGILNQDMIDLYYSRFNKSKMYHNSVLLLKKFMKNIDYPFWERSRVNYFSKIHMFEIYACNLIPIIMDVVDFDENNFKSVSLKEKRIKVTFKQLINIEYENYIGYVNSLDVDKHKLYLADGILTHNSIYGFAGADFDSYKKLCRIPNTEQLPLSTTFRCPNKVIELVRPLNSQIQPFESNPEGEIIEGASYKDIKDGDMILCRQAFPVVSLCMRYLSQGKSAYIIGSDIGKSLISMITRNERKTEEYIMENVFARLDKEYDKIVEKLMTSHKLTQKEAENQTTSVSFREKIMAIESIAGNLRDPNEVIMKINAMFSDNNKNGICLSTIHKAKGLENDRVFILMPDLMPSQYAKEDWEHIQEDNLRYVAYTRAKKVLGFITDYDAYTTRMNSPRSKTVVKDSKHIGIVGEFKYLTLKVVNIRNIKTQFGDTKLYEMVDEDGNLFKKWGDIKARYITGSGFTINVDTKLAFMGKIKSHGEYQGIKETIIGNIM